MCVNRDSKRVYNEYRKAMENIKERLYIATFSEDATTQARKYGVGLEINHTCISEELDPQHRNGLLSQIKDDAKAAGVTDTSNLLLHGPFTEIHPAGIDYRAREFAMGRLEQAYEVAAELGVKKMIVHTGWLPFIYFKEWQAEKGAIFWEKFMADKPSDFVICVENVLEDEPFMLLDMMKRIEDPRIKLCIDVGHANAMTQDDIRVEKWIETLAPYIGHFHLHNNDGTGDSHSAFDKGSMDMERILKLIDELCSPDVTLTIEARDAASCLEWLAVRGFFE